MALPGVLRLPTLLGVALAGDRVLDFGGAAGLHYRVAKYAFPARPFRWAVFDTPLMAARARRLESDELRFFSSIDDAMRWLGRVDCVHSVAALQYVAAPEDMVATLVGLKAPVMLWAKLELGVRRETAVQSSRLKDNGPGPLPPDVEDREVICTFTRIRESDFVACHHGYRAIWRDGSRAFLFMTESHC